MMTQKWFFNFVIFNFFLKVCGAILGKQSGRDVEIWNSFELKSSIVESHLVLDEEYFVQRNLLCKYFLILLLLSELENSGKFSRRRHGVWGFDRLPSFSINYQLFFKF